MPFCYTCGLSLLTPICPYCKIDSRRIVYPELNRTIMPLPDSRPALVVPLDHENVVPIKKNRLPYDVIDHMFEKELNQMMIFSNNLQPFFNPNGISNEKIDNTSPHWINNYISIMDAKILYSITRFLKPHTIIEIGSGNSTKFFRKAILDGQLSTKLISIDPSPRSEIDDIVDEKIRTSITDVSLEIFDNIRPNDFVFLDGSHLVFNGSDIPFFFLRILPILPRGVIIHLHDIYLPEEYPEMCDSFYYNEQYVLGAFLLNNPLWKVLVPVHYLYEKNILPSDGVSFWMKKIG